MAKKIKYIDNDVVFNDVKEPGIALPSVPISRNNNYTYNEAEDQITGIQFKTINSIDIDWNEAEVEENIKISTTGQFINWINQKFRSIPEPPTWSTLSGKPNFATVATTGSYNDLTDKPNFFDGDYYSLTNKPTIPTVPSNVGAFTNDSGYITQSELEGALGNIDLTNNKTVKDYIDDNAVNSSSLTALENRVGHLESHNTKLKQNIVKYVCDGDIDYLNITNFNNIHSIVSENKGNIVIKNESGYVSVQLRNGTSNIVEETLTITCTNYDTDGTYFAKIKYIIYPKANIVYTDPVQDPSSRDSIETIDGETYITRNIAVGDNSLVEIESQLKNIASFECENECITAVHTSTGLQVHGVVEGESEITFRFYGNDPQILKMKYVVGQAITLVGSTTRNINKIVGYSYQDTVSVTGPTNVYIKSVKYDDQRIQLVTPINDNNHTNQIQIKYIKGGISWLTLQCLDPDTGNFKTFNLTFNIKIMQDNNHPLSNNVDDDFNSYVDEQSQVHNLAYINQTYTLSLNDTAYWCQATLNSNVVDSDYVKFIQDTDSDYKFFVKVKKPGTYIIRVKGRVYVDCYITVEGREGSNLTYQYQNQFQWSSLDYFDKTKKYWIYSNESGNNTDCIEFTLTGIQNNSGGDDLPLNDYFSSVTSSNPIFLIPTITGTNNTKITLNAPYVSGEIYPHDVTITAVTNGGTTYTIYTKVFPHNFIRYTETCTLNGQSIRYINRNTVDQEDTISVNYGLLAYTCSDHPEVVDPYVNTDGTVKVRIIGRGNACVCVTTHPDSNIYGSNTFYIFYSVENNNAPNVNSMFIPTTDQSHPRSLQSTENDILAFCGTITNVKINPIVISNTNYYPVATEYPYANGEYGENFRNTCIVYAQTDAILDTSFKLELTNNNGITADVWYKIVQGTEFCNIGSSNSNVFFGSRIPTTQLNSTSIERINTVHTTSSPVKYTPQFILSAPDTTTAKYYAVKWMGKVGNLYVFYPIVRIYNNVINTVAYSKVVNKNSLGIRVNIEEHAAEEQTQYNYRLSEDINKDSTIFVDGTIYQEHEIYSKLKSIKDLQQNVVDTIINLTLNEQIITIRCDGYPYMKYYKFQKVYNVSNYYWMLGCFSETPVTSYVPSSKTEISRAIPEFVANSLNWTVKEQGFNIDGTLSGGPENEDYTSNDLYTASAGVIIEDLSNKTIDGFIEII